MDQHDIFAISAVALASMRYGIYFYTIYQGKTKPHAFSWLLWGIVTGIGALTQFSYETGPAAWALSFVSIACLTISSIAFIIGDRNYKKSDWAALVIAFVAIPVWQITDNPLYALPIIITIDMLSYWPTIRKTYHHPETEPPISYWLAGLRYLLIILAIPEPTWQNALYPFALVFIDWGFVTYNVTRRAQLGHPLHEYAKAKNSD